MLIHVGNSILWVIRQINKWWTQATILLQRVQQLSKLLQITHYENTVWHLHCSVLANTTMPSVPTLPNYPRVCRISAKSPGLLYMSPNLKTIICIFQTYFGWLLAFSLKRFWGIDTFWWLSWQHHTSSDHEFIIGDLPYFNLSLAWLSAMLRPVYTGDFCRSNSMQFLSRSRLQLQNRTCKPGAIFSAIRRRDIAGVSNMFETWCDFGATKDASSCWDKNRLCKRAFSVLVISEVASDNPLTNPDMRWCLSWYSNFEVNNYYKAVHCTLILLYRKTALY